MTHIQNRIVPTFIVLSLSSVITLAGCTKESDRYPESQQEEASAGPTNRIDIPGTVRSNLGITFAKVERRRVDSTIRMPGSFELQPLARHEYRLTLPGAVKLEVDQFQRVEPGDLLYRLNSPEWPELQHEIIEGEQSIDAARSDIEIARARMDEAERRQEIMRERLSLLTEADIRSADLEAQFAELEASMPRLRTELEQAEMRLNSAERIHEHSMHRASVVTGIEISQLASVVDHDGQPTQAYQMIDWIEVYATEPGVVEMLALTDGSFAEAPSLVLSTIDPSKVRFRAMALQSDLVRIGESPEAKIVPPTMPGITLNDGVNASVTIGLEAHPEQRTVTLLANPEEGRSWIRPGVSAFLEVIVESSGGPALAIPRAAIVKDGITHVFFRRDPQDPNKAIRVEADMGVDDGRWVAINSGLSPTDEVVLDGAYELKLATEQSGATQKGGHFHADGTFHNED